VSESHPEAQNGIKTLQYLLPYATQMQLGWVNFLSATEQKWNSLWVYTKAWGGGAFVRL